MVSAGRTARAVGVWWARAVRWLESRDVDEEVLLIACGAAIGAAAGLGVVAFYHLIDAAYWLFIAWPARTFGLGPHLAYLPLLTALALWGAWMVVRRAGVPDGQNVPDVQLAVAKQNGRVRMRPVVVRTIASAITLGGGGSAGSEGPVAVLGAGLGSAAGRLLRLQPRRVKILVGCGAAAGISGAFSAPFAGAFFALEEVLGSFAVGAFSPVLVASVAGALTVRPFLGRHPAFLIPKYGDTHAWTVLVLFPFLGVACGLCSALYTRLFFATAARLERAAAPAWARPVVGGLAVGAVTLLSGGLLLGNGHLAIPNEVFGAGDLAWYALVALAVAKIVATSVTLGAGGSGGVFTPTLFIGAALGGGLGRLAAGVIPGHGVHPEVWGLVGMAGLVAGATRAPLTAIFMVFDMTDDYGIVPALVVVAVIAYVTAHRFAPHGLYDGWLARRGEQLSHGADRAIMDRLHVRDAVDRRVVTVAPGATLADVVAATRRTRHTTLAVVDHQRLVGVIAYDDLREAMLDRGDLAPLLVAADLAVPTETLTPRQSLREALSRMNARAVDALPVVEGTGDGDADSRFVGMLTRADLLAAYERELAHAV